MWDSTIGAGTVLAGSAAAGALPCGGGAPRHPAAEIRELAIISKQPDKYHGWPTSPRRKTGQLLVSCSGGRDAHGRPFGAVEWSSSDDGGATARGPRAHGHADRRPRFGRPETARVRPGDTVTSLAYCRFASGPERSPRARTAPARGKNGRWAAVHSQRDEAQRKAQLGSGGCVPDRWGKTFGAA